MATPRTSSAPGRVLAAGVAAATLSLGAVHPASAFTVTRFDVARAQALRDLAGNVIHVRGLRDLGRQGANEPVRVSLLMRAQHEDQLRQLVALQANPKSAYYKHFLTSAQYDNYFAPSPAVYARTIRMMQQRGFRVTQTFANRGMIRAIMPTGAAERYFQTEIHRVYQPGAGYRYINVKPVVVPAEIKAVAASVVGLHSASSIHTFHTTARGRRELTPLQMWAWETSLLASHPHKALTPAQLARLQALRAGTLPGLGAGRTARVAARTSGAPLAAPASQLVHPAFIGETAAPFKSPEPISTTTPAANPNPDPTISPDDGTTDYVGFQALGPGVFAGGYDFPVMHGYGGSGAGVATLLDGDYLDSDAKSEITTFGVPRATTADVPNQLGMRVYTDGTKYTTTDSGGAEETTLDAETILSMAPAANYYLYLEPSFDDEGLTSSYEKIVSDNLVGVVSSSFGSCETDDPAFGYQTDYIAMEGSAEGITFMASTGDTGGNSCGVYVTNGAPQTEKGVAVPSADIFFTAVGGTDYLYLPAVDGATYPTAGENGWSFGGGGVSVINPLPTWQAATAGITTTGRNTPDLAFVADNMEPSSAIIVFETGTEEAVGGTSLSSPLFAALQTEINQVEGTRNGWIDPRLYAIQAQQGYYAFHDVATGTNEDYVAGTGYDNVTGIGSVDGWFLAGEE